MGIVKTVSDFFRGTTNKKIDRYGIITPLMSAEDYIEKTGTLFDQGDWTHQVADILTGKTKPANVKAEKAIQAYKNYISGLPSQEKSQESSRPLSTINQTLTIIHDNLMKVEDNFTALFGSDVEGVDEAALRSSSLVVIGYIETATDFCAWVGSLIAHATADESDPITPFQTTNLLNQAKMFGDFAGFNLVRWNSKGSGLLGAIKDMQKRGADIALKTGDSWMDQFVGDSAFSPIEGEMMTAAIRSPIMMAITGRVALHQWWIELLTHRKAWMMSKIIFEQAKMTRMDPESAEYKRLKQVTEKYGALVTQYERKIERSRA